MAVHPNAAHDLLVGLYCLEAGVIDRHPLAGVARTWARSPGQSLSEAIAGAGVDATLLARLEARVQQELAGLEETVVYAGRSPKTIDTAAHQPSARYLVVRPHARGGLGEVFVAFDGELKRSVALKELQARLAHDRDSQARFL